jgi:hypothetical protein
MLEPSPDGGGALGETMTEQDWLTGTDPWQMRHVLFQAGVRKMLLFMVACCQLNKACLNNRRSRMAVQVAERYSDGLASPEEFHSAGSAEFFVTTIPILLRDQGGAEHAKQVELLRDIGGNPFRTVLDVDSAWLAWNDATVVKLAHGIYEERAFDRLPILADALEEAGCTNPDILNHCRRPGAHVRGCWVVDALLEKG